MIIFVAFKRTKEMTRPVPPLFVVLHQVGEKNSELYVGEKRQECHATTLSVRASTATYSYTYLASIPRSRWWITEYERRSSIWR